MKGIKCISKNRKYEASVMINGKKKIIGYWSTDKEAELMRNAYKAKHKITESKEVKND
ncbi:MAG: hypothetical protein K8R79_07310 [Calditrichales bacterium]|nr:hypothetical protein [Calditrichales bacterium]